jgi:SAM-dependent methyltransferase
VTLSPLDMRRSRLMGLLDVGQGRGLEIGPLHSPITKDVKDVHYVDVFSQEQLRANYAHDPSVELSDIPEIHFTLSGPEGIRSLSEAVRPAAPFSWAAASHVVEHVPDIISWLAELAEILVDGGQLLLVVPDRRFTFDILRPCTTVGQMLQAHELRETRPSVRAVYDMFRTIVTVGASDAWEGVVPSQEDRKNDLIGTINQVERARDGDYVDCHVWMFTPASFVEQINELGRLDLCDFVVETIVSTPRNDIEFNVVLRRLPRALKDGQLCAARAAGVLEISDTDPVRDRHEAELERLATENAASQAELEDSLLAATQRAQDLEGSVLAATQQANKLADELARVKASERWRLGGLATIPASALKRLLAR